MAKAIIHTESGRTEVVPVSDYMAAVLTAYAKGDRKELDRLLAMQKRRPSRDKRERG